MFTGRYIKNLLFALLIFSVVLSSCSPQRRDYLGRVQALEEGNTTKIDQQSVEKLEKEINSLRDDVEKITKDTEKLGTFYKMLAVDFIDAGMFGPAYEYLQEALSIYPENHVLYYYAAISCARIARTKGAAEDRRSELTKAEYYYLEALKLKPDYRDALYGLGVLYVFELNTPQRAIPHLEKLAAMDEKNTDVRFVLARAYAAVGEVEAAEKEYREIQKISPDGDAAEQAGRLLSTLQGESQ